MKIASVFIQDLKGFSGFQLDLTYPEGHPRAGEALDKICLIGSNGTGKSRLLKLLISYIRELVRFKSKALFIAKLEVRGRFIYSVHLRNEVLFFRDTIDEEPSWMAELMVQGAFTLEFNRKFEKYCIGFTEEPELFEELWFDNNSNDLLVYQPSEPAKNRILGLADLPLTKTRDVESYRGNYPFYNEVSPERVVEFWSLLIWTILQRDRAFKDHVKKPAYKTQSTAVMRADFLKEYPEILPGLAALWNEILEPVGLEADLENADEPISSSDPLELYIRRKGGDRINYSELGAGMRRFLFGLGHIWVLNYGRTISNGFCFVEEPETHLHPSIVQGVVGRYENLAPGQQLFMTTHSPFVAAQFDPAERLILDGNEVRRSEAEAGAEVSTILEKDFS